MNTVKIRQASLSDLPLLLEYRRAMATEMGGADEVALNRTLAALAGVAPLKSCNGSRECWTRRQDGLGSTAFTSSHPVVGAASVEDSQKP